MRVQGAQLPDVNLRGLPTPSAGPTASAEHFGAGNYRQLGQFGRAVQGFGEEVIRQDQIYRRKEDETFSRNAVNEAQKRLADQKKAVYDQYKGQASYQAPEKMAALTKRIRDEVSKGLLNQHQKDAFASAMDSIENQSQLEAMGYRDRQMEVARLESLDSQNELIREQGAANSEAANTPDGQAANRGRLEQIYDNINQRYAGMPEEVLSVKRREGAVKFHGGILDTMSPTEALKYIDDNSNGVQQALGAAVTKKLKEALSAKAKATADHDLATRQAIADVNDPNITSDDRFERAAELFPGDPTMQKFYLAQGDDYEKRKKDTVNRKATEEESATWKAYAEGGYELAKIPVGVSTNNPDMFKRMVEFNKWLKDAGNEKLDPDLSYRNELLSMKPSELRAKLAEPGGADTMMRRMAGKAEYINQIYDYSRKEDSSVGDGTGTKGTSTKFSPSKFFEDSYQSLYQTGYVWTEGEKFDAKGLEAKSRRNGFELRYEDRLAQKEEELGRKANYQECKEIGYQLVRDFKSGDVNFDSSIYDEAQIAATEGATISITADNLTPEQKAVNDSEPRQGGSFYKKKNALNGEVETFKRISMGDVFKDIADAKPKQVLRAFQKGQYELGGADYEMGDYIVIQRDGSIQIYQSNWTPRGNKIVPAASVESEAKKMDVAAAAQQEGAPEWSGQMKALKDEYGDNAKSHWNGEETVISTPEGTYFFDETGRQVDFESRIGIPGSMGPL